MTQKDYPNICYKNTTAPVDWTYYARFYPEKTKAIQRLRLDTGLGLKEAKEIVEEIFSKHEQGTLGSGSSLNCISENNYQNAPSSANEGWKKAGKGMGCGCFTLIVVFLGSIFKLAGMYSGKRK